MQQILLNGLIAGGIYALTALGFAVIYRTVRFFHFAHGAVYTAGAYAAYSLGRAGLNALLAVFFSLAISAAIGVAIDRVVYRPLRLERVGDLVYLIASFGVFIFVQNFIQLLYGAQILTIQTGAVVEGRHIFAAVITDTQILILIVTLLLLSLAWTFIQRSRLGKATRAVADDPIGASVSGIFPEKVISLSFAIGSALAGAAGMLVGLETNIEPAMGLTAIFKGMIAAIIGGVGSIPGAVAGGFLLGIVENLGIWKIPAEWKDSIAFGILILFLLLKPGGIAGVPTKQERV